MGDTYIWDDQYKFDCPDQIETTLKYPESFQVHFCVNFGNGAGNRTAMYGTHGIMEFERSKPSMSGEGAFEMDALDAVENVEPVKCPEHMANWIECMRSRKPNLRDWDAVRQYKREALRWGMHIQSLAGIWDPGVQIHAPGAAESIAKSVRAAEMLGAGVILAAFFEKNAPDMSREDSYGPVVENLQRSAPRAAEAGVRIGLENSLSPQDNKKLVDLVGHPAVGVYYDLHNMAQYGHGAEAVPGVALLGRERLCMIHVKNEDKLIEEPGALDWAAAFQALNEIQYDGWYVYETKHGDIEDCIEDTKKNIAYMRQVVRMPLA